MTTLTETHIQPPPLVARPPKYTGVVVRIDGSMVGVAANVGGIWNGYSNGGVQNGGVEMGHGRSTDLGPAFQTNHQTAYGFGQNGAHYGKSNEVSVAGQEASVSESCKCGLKGFRYNLKCCDKKVCCCAFDTDCCGSVFKGSVSMCETFGDCLSGICNMLDGCD